MKKLFGFFIAFTLPFVFIACGSGEQSVQSKSIKGKVYDELLVGLSYITKGFEGQVTNDEGEFSYQSGPVSFYLGNLFLGSINSMPEDKKVFLSDILNLQRGDVAHKKLIKIATLLQSLDKTSEDDNKIILDQQKINELFSGSGLSVENLDLQSLGLELVPENEVLKRLKKTYKEHNIAIISKPPIAKTNNSNSIQKGKMFTLDASNSVGVGELTYQWLDENDNEISTQKIYELNTSTLKNGLNTIKLIVKNEENQVSKADINISVLTPKYLFSVPENLAENVKSDSIIALTYNFAMQDDSSKYALYEYDINPTISSNMRKINIKSITHENEKTFINLDSNLSKDKKKYVLSIDKNLKDTLNNPLGIDQNITFYTQDKMPPSVVKIEPVQNVELMPKIKITFSEKILQSSLNTDNIKLLHANDSIEYELNTSNNPIISLTPNEPLAYQESYIVKVSHVKDLQENALEDEIEHTFTTKKDTTEIKLSSNFDTILENIPLNQQINITFNKPMDKTSITKQNITFSPNVEYDIIVHSDTNISIKPKNSYKINTNYELHLQNLKDKYGIKMSDKTYAFSTQKFKNYFISSHASNGNGSSWDEALSVQNLQNILQNLHDKNVTLWFKNGEYNISNTINIDKNITLYGGFEGNETKLEQRVLDKNTTFIGNDQKAIFKINSFANVAIDGFTFLHQNDENGTALVLQDANLSVKNAMFKNNSSNLGGGIMAKKATLNLQNVAFIDNTNALYLDEVNASVKNATFEKNEVAIISKSNSHVSIINSTFAKNTAQTGVIVDNSQSLELINTTFSENNISQNNGGVIYYDNQNVSIKNSIIWGNNKGLYNAQTYNPASIANSIIQQNSQNDPQLDILKHKIVKGVRHAYYELKASSKAVNAGDNSFNNEENDQINNVRKYQNIDIGAIEMGKFPPRLLSSIPSNNEQVEANSNISLMFSEDINSSTINQNNIKLLDNNQASFTNFHFSVDGKNVKIILDSPLLGGKTYTLHVSGVKDTSGSEMQKPFDVKFQTLSFKRQNDKNIVIDFVNNLTWQDNLDVKNQRKNFHEAKQYCASLSLGGYENGWRLPTLDELKSIVINVGNDEERKTNEIFQNEAKGFVWSGDEAQNNRIKIINFDDGTQTLRHINEKAKIRCVR